MSMDAMVDLEITRERILDLGAQRNAGCAVSQETEFRARMVGVRVFLAEEFGLANDDRCKAVVEGVVVYTGAPTYVMDRLRRNGIPVREILRVPRIWETSGGTDGR